MPEQRAETSHLPDALIDIIRRSLQGETFVPVAQVFEVLRSHAHGHAQAVALATQRLGPASVIASQPCRERDLVLAMLALRIVQPDTELTTSRRWHCSAPVRFRAETRGPGLAPAGLSGPADHRRRPAGCDTRRGATRSSGYGRWAL